MVRTLAKRELRELSARLGKAQLRMAAVYLAYEGKTTKRFVELWNHPVVREQAKSKSLLQSTLSHMVKIGVLRKNKISHRIVKYTLLVQPPGLSHQQVEDILSQPRIKEQQEQANNIASRIDQRRPSPEEIQKLVQGMFLRSERERLYTLIQLLPIYRDPKLWPFLWPQMMLGLVQFPTIMQLQILRACQDKYPEETNRALSGLDQMIQRILASEALKDYPKTYDSLAKPASARTETTDKQQPRI